MTELFPHAGTLIGMVHVGALPGTPDQSEPLARIVQQAVDDARLLCELGFEALIVENMFDRPYLLRTVGPEIVASMTAVCREVRSVAADVPLGVQVLAGANEAALAVALAADAQFIRAEGFVFSAVADEGLIPEAGAGPLLRYRRVIGAQHIQVLCDIQKKHSSHAITSDLSIAETARAAAFCGADGLIVTGTATGAATSVQDLEDVANAVDLPVLVGSGVTPPQVRDLLPRAAGFIVGSYIKEGGAWTNPVDAERSRELVLAVRNARGS